MTKNQEFLQLRQKLGLTQLQAATLLHVHPRTICSWENAYEGYTNENDLQRMIDLLQYRHDKSRESTT